MKINWFWPMIASWVAIATLGVGYMAEKDLAIKAAQRQQAAEMRLQQVIGLCTAPHEPAKRKNPVIS